MREKVNKCSEQETKLKRFGQGNPWDSPGKNTRAGFHALLQGIFLTPGVEPKSLTSPVLAGGFFTTSATWEAKS